MGGGRGGDFGLTPCFSLISAFFLPNLTKSFCEKWHNNVAVIGTMNEEFKNFCMIFRMSLMNYNWGGGMQFKIMENWEVLD